MLAGFSFVEEKLFKFLYFFCSEGVIYNSKEKVHQEVEVDHEVGKEEEEGEWGVVVGWHHHIWEVCSGQKHKQVDETEEESLKIRGTICVVRGTKKIKAKNRINDHDEEQETQHIKNRWEAFENLSDEPSDSTTIVSVNQEEDSQSPCYSEVTFVSDQDNHSLCNHHN